MVREKCAAVAEFMLGLAVQARESDGAEYNRLDGELMAVEVVLRRLGIEFEYEYDEWLYPVAVSVGGCKVESEEATK